MGGILLEINYREVNFDDIEMLFDFFMKLKEETGDVSFSEVENKKEIIDWVQDCNTYMIIAESDNNELLGIFRAIRGDVGREHSCFLTIAVKLKFRGKGIAKSLTKYGVSIIKQKGVKIARAYVYSNNIQSVNVLLKLGFVLSGCVHMHHYNSDESRFVDDLIFHKIL